MVVLFFIIIIIIFFFFFFFFFFFYYHYRFVTAFLLNILVFYHIIFIKFIFFSCFFLLLLLLSILISFISLSCNVTFLFFVFVLMMTQCSINYQSLFHCLTMMRSNFFTFCLTVDNDVTNQHLLIASFSFFFNYGQSFFYWQRCNVTFLLFIFNANFLLDILFSFFII